MEQIQVMSYAIQKRYAPLAPYSANTATKKQKWNIPTLPCQYRLQRKNVAKAQTKNANIVEKL